MIDTFDRADVFDGMKSLTSFNGIFIKGARENNLKNIDVKIPRNKITVVTGLSGSGKSSLAFDVLYSEGHRHYMESLSSSASSYQLMESFKKPDVDFITGLSPAIAIDQRDSRASPRSTVGTVTEIYDFMRLLFSHKGVPECPEHKLKMEKQSLDQMVKDIMKLPKGTKFLVLAPVVQGKKGQFLSDFEKWSRKGFLKMRVDGGSWVDIGKSKALSRYKAHDIELLLDKLIVDDQFLDRLKESLNLALSLTKGVLSIEILGGESRLYSLHSTCPQCHYAFPKLDISFFSFNNPRGACDDCKGLGLLNDGDQKRGDQRSEEENWSLCTQCKGTRLKDEVLSVRFHGKNIFELSSLPALDLFSYLEKAQGDLVSKKIIKPILKRLNYMIQVGVGYLPMGRSVQSLSKGEMQRVRMATQAGSALRGVTYVLDEPSIGLHPKDHYQLLNVLKDIKEKGNTVFVVEHDRESILFADHVIDLGPGAGKKGGEVIVEGTPQEVSSHKLSLTGGYLSERLFVSVPKKRREIKEEQKILLRGAKGHNLKGIDVEFPLGVLCGVTGVSGSGKSSLIMDTLYPVLAKKLYHSPSTSLSYQSISGLDGVKHAIQINQKPIGRTPRSIPATYVGLFSLIRELYSKLPEAKIRGYNLEQFSFNVKGGRCEECKGQALIRVKMNFLQDVFILCESCKGLRFSPGLLSVKYKGKSIADVLSMTVAEALEFFKYHNLIYRKLKMLMKVNLEYLQLGQSSVTLSGGEAQRIKLSRELSKRSSGQTLYILDEPTTGLHFEDVRKLIDLLQELVNLGHTVLVIEHNLDVIKSCDYIIDLGPEGGPRGGRITASGTPEEISKKESSETGRFLRQVL